MSKRDTHGYPVFVLDEFRAILILDRECEGLRILFGVWDGERNWT